VQQESVEPDAFLIRDKDARDKLFGALYTDSQALPEAWMDMLRTCDLTWDGEPTTLYVEEAR
jgi:hypothetical protein